MTRNVEEIRADVERERRQLVESAQSLKGQVRGTLDVRSRLGPRAIVAAAGAFVALLLVTSAIRALLRATTRLVAEKVRAVAA